ncbi:hypothetical protein OIO90_004805 [Microbotryomycetes sp. JL221]|nr:hypothetical protein OIO90_004805 [Microbotryomycetes sp. JL221]
MSQVGDLDQVTQAPLDDHKTSRRHLLAGLRNSVHGAPSRNVQGSGPDLDLASRALAAMQLGADHVVASFRNFDPTMTPPDRSPLNPASPSGERLEYAGPSATRDLALHTHVPESAQLNDIALSNPLVASALARRKRQSIAAARQAELEEGEGAASFALNLTEQAIATDTASNLTCRPGLQPPFMLSRATPPSSHPSLSTARRRRPESVASLGLGAPPGTLTAFEPQNRHAPRLMSDSSGQFATSQNLLAPMARSPYLSSPRHASSPAGQSSPRFSHGTAHPVRQPRGPPSDLQGNWSARLRKNAIQMLRGSAAERQAFMNGPDVVVGLGVHGVAIDQA